MGPKMGQGTTKGPKEANEGPRDAQKGAQGAREEPKVCPRASPEAQWSFQMFYGSPPLGIKPEWEFSKPEKLEFSNPGNGI